MQYCSEFPVSRLLRLTVLVAAVALTAFAGAPRLGAQAPPPAPAPPGPAGATGSKPLAGRAQAIAIDAIRKVVRVMDG